MAAFARFAWGVLGYDVAVAAWGAYVRATGSGAGCGRHWPTCTGQVVPHAPGVETLIEYSHRVSSGGAVLLTLLLWVWARMAFPRGHRVRGGAAAALLLMLMEALIGAGLVLLGLVAHDESIARAASLCVHLVNTFLLLASTALTAWWASGGASPRWRGERAVVVLVGVPLGAMFVVGASGAIAALGDTLFPASSLAAGFAQDLAPNVHALLRLRAIHPLVAVATAVGIVFACGLLRSLRPTTAVRRCSLAATGLAVAQVAAGLLDLLMRAPVVVQLVHLALADGVWISLVLTAAAALSSAPAGSSTGVAAPLVAPSDPSPV